MCRSRLAARPTLAQILADRALSAPAASPGMCGWIAVAWSRWWVASLLASLAVRRAAERFAWGMSLGVDARKSCGSVSRPRPLSAHKRPWNGQTSGSSCVLKLYPPFACGGRPTSLSRSSVCGGTAPTHSGHSRRPRGSGQARTPLGIPGLSSGGSRANPQRELLFRLGASLPAAEDHNT